MRFASLLERQVHPGIVKLANYCTELAGPSDLPYRSEFRPSRVASIITYVFVVDILPGEEDYYFSHFGSSMTILFGMDLWKKRLSKIGDEAVREELRKTYDHVAATGKPLYLRGRYEWPEMSIGIERLLVPMRDESGKVNSLLGVSIPDIPDDTVLVFAGQGAAQLVVDEITTLH